MKEAELNVMEKGDVILFSVGSDLSESPGFVLFVFLCTRTRERCENGKTNSPDKFGCILKFCFLNVRNSNKIDYFYNLR